MESWLGFWGQKQDISGKTGDIQTVWTSINSVALMLIS